MADYLHAFVANNECFIARQDNQPWDSKESQSAIDGGYQYFKKPEIDKAQDKEGILPVVTERAWLMWPNRLFWGRGVHFLNF